MMMVMLSNVINMKMRPRRVLIRPGSVRRLVPVRNAQPLAGQNQWNQD